MAFTFSSDDIAGIVQMLGSAPQHHTSDGHDEYFFNLSNEQTRQSLTLTLANNVELGGEGSEREALVIAQTQHGYFELHGCTAFMVFEPDEIIFIRADGERISGMVVGKQCTCSMFVDVCRENLSANYAELDPRLLMSAMQLSVTEVMLSMEE